jgi:alpha-tubulin suppressor-like RCC1 family protein
VAAAGPLSVVLAGYYATCALSSAGAAWCWGMNGDGQVGDNAVEDRATPVAVGRGLPFTSISVGDRFVCAISSGSTWCWGANRAGETGTDMQGALLPRQLTTPPASAVFTSAGASTVPGTEPFGCVLASDDRVSCWGGAIDGLRARGPIAPLDSRVRTRAAAPGARHVCVLSTDGFAYCGGSNFAGQLGDGTHITRPALVPIPGPLP